MHRLAILIACLSAFGATQAPCAQGRPKNIRVTVEYIEVSHQLVTALMTGPHADSGPKLHARMRELVKENKAHILETSIITARSGYRARVESVMEHIYPTEYEPPSLSSRPPPEEREGKARTRNPTAFETQNVGITLDIAPVFQPGKPFIDLRFTQEMTALLRYNTLYEHQDQWGDTSIRFPIYDAQESKCEATLLNGQFSLLNLLAPTHKDGGPDTTRKILLFVRADVISIGS